MSFITEQERNLIITGVSMGLIHVLAGPDHLSALAALAVGTSYKSFLLGVRWGIGHSTGLVVVAIIFIALKGDLDLRTLGRYCDSLVGIFMISLGCYGVISAIRSYREKRQKRDRDDLPTISLISKPRTPKQSTSHGQHHHHQHHQVSHDIITSNNVISTIPEHGTLRRSSSSSATLKTDIDVESGPGILLINEKQSSQSTEKDDTTMTEDNLHLDMDSETSHLLTSINMKDNKSICSPSNNKDEDSFLKKSTEKKKKTFWSLIFDHSHHQHHSGVSLDDHPTYAVEECDCCPYLNMQDPATQRCLSFVIGLLHGVAGPGGILGVLPAVEMQKWTSSVLYLGSFILASTLSMGTFAALYGESTRRLGATTEMMELGLSVFSSGMSIVVGVIWFVFSIIGKLDDFFH